MSKTFFKYLSVFSLLFFSGFSNLHANSIADINVKGYSTITESTFNHGTIKLNQNRHTTDLVIEITEVDESENEESSSKNHQLSFKEFLADFLSLLSYDDTLQTKKAFHYYKNYQDKSSTKLHVRLQVFII